MSILTPSTDGSCCMASASTKIDSYFKNVPGYTNLTQAIERVEKFISHLHFTTPLYEYSLLNEDVGFPLTLKLENLARLGDIAARGFLGILGLSMPEDYITPATTCESLPGYVSPSIGYDNDSISSPETITPAVEGSPKANLITDICFAITPGSSFAINCQGLTCTARYAHLSTKIFISESSLNLLTIYLLYNCKQMGAQVIVLHGNEDADAAARKYCKNLKSTIYIDEAADGEMALIGLMTCCNEVFNVERNSKIRKPSIIVVPEESQPFYGYPLAGAFGIYMEYYELLSQCQLVTTKGAAIPRQAVLTNTIQPFVFNSVNSCRLDLVFDAWDCDHDGCLQLSELASVYSELSDLVTPESNEEYMRSHLEILQRLFSSSPKDMIDKIGRLNESLTVSSLTEIVLNQIDLAISLYSSKNIDRIIKFSPTYLRASGTIRSEPFLVSRTDELRALKTALNVTHTYASGLSNHALAACLSYEHGDKLRSILSSFDNNNFSENTVCAIIVGGLVDPLVFENEIGEALQIDNQLVRFRVTIPKDGRLQAKVCSTISKCGLNTVKISIDSFRQNTCLSMRITAYSSGICATERCRAELEKFVISFEFQTIGHDPSDINLQHIETQCPSDVDEKYNKKELEKESKNLIPFSLEPFSIKSSNEITLESVQLALCRLNKYNAIHETLIYRTNTYSRIVNQMYGYDTPETAASIYLMLENTQRTGSFKVRGSSNMIIKAYEYSKDPDHGMMPMNGVVACSAGNHAQGVALISQKLGIPCTIVCPETAPLTKLENTKRYGAEVVPHGRAFDDSLGFGKKICEERNWTFIPPFAAWEIIEGQATIALQLLQKQPDLDTIVINVGGGGMIAGCAIVAKLWAAKRGKPIRVVGVQASVVHPLRNYKEKGMLTFVDPAAQTLADGCNVKVPGGIHNEILRNYVDEYICVEENEIAATIVHTLMRTRTLCEGAGCMGVTALLYGKLHVKPGEKVGVVMCGGNIDVTRICAISKYGLKALGRAVTIEVEVPDTAGQLTKICEIASRHNMIAENIMHLRESEGVQWDHCKLVVTLWCNSFDSINRVLIAILEETGFIPRIVDQNAVPNARALFRPFEEKKRELEHERRRKIERERSIFENNEISKIVREEN